MYAGTLKFKTIAVAMDLSHTGSSALRYAQEIARLHNATLVIVHVIDPVSYAFPSGEPESLKGKRNVQQEIQRMEEETRLRGIPVHSVVETGVIYEHILQAVKDYHADLLVLGTHARTEAGRVALGTVARRLLAKAPCTILTVPPDAEGNRPAKWRRVLVGVDFSKASRTALELAQKIVQEKLLVIHATESTPQKQATNFLEQLRFLAPLNESHTVPVEHAVATAEASKLIVGYAKAYRADLIVLGSPTAELTPRQFATSTALQVVSEASCPVLFVPSDYRCAPSKENHSQEVLAC